jgi:hypothetical protein
LIRIFVLGALPYFARKSISAEQIKLRNKVPPSEYGTTN